MGIGGLHLHTMHAATARQTVLNQSMKHDRRPQCSVLRFDRPLWSSDALWVQSTHIHTRTLCEKDWSHCCPFSFLPTFKFLVIVSRCTVLINPPQGCEIALTACLDLHSPKQAEAAALLEKTRLRKVKRVAFVKGLKRNGVTVLKWDCTCLFLITQDYR